ncbi:Agap011844-pa [Plakobranchus ocellatus]|uniref:Agap011844-pa, partial n=1 Tax=Plakobranchus ocellatus TaxID=259542 RepID=A0AAV4D818_9GAST|nr:Agap011844-pa [Plakobranchus ocellatus]
MSWPSPNAETRLHYFHFTGKRSSIATGQLASPSADQMAGGLHFRLTLPRQRYAPTKVRAIVSDNQPNPALCGDYARYLDAIYATEGVILYNDRVVVPSSLRKVILKDLHAAHQGISSMEL